MLTIIKNKKITIIIIIGLLVALMVSLKLAGTRQDIRKKAAGGGATNVELTVNPLMDTINLNETKVFILKAHFTDGTGSEHLDGFRTEVNFPKEYLQVPEYVDVSSSGFQTIFRVDQPVVSNSSGKIIIELGADGVDTGPATDKEIIIAKIKFKAVKISDPSQKVKVTINGSLDATQIVSGISSAKIPFTVKESAYTIVNGGTTVAPTITVSPTITGSCLQPVCAAPPTNCTYQGGDGCTTCGTLVCLTSTPSVTPNPTITTVPTITSTQLTPGSGRDRYIIDVGNKQSLNINVGQAVTPQIRFKAKLARVFNSPDMYLRLRVKDDLAFTAGNIGSTNDMCNNPPNGTYDYFVPVKADSNGVYSPVTQNSKTAPSGRKIATVSADGWILLDGIQPGKYYSIYLKGPKTTSSIMTKHTILQPNQNTQTQDFDWTGNMLQAGDLPDPSSGFQDCTVNAFDLSVLETTLYGKTDQASLDIADVNYDGVINGADIASVVVTLSTKPDDDF